MAATISLGNLRPSSRCVMRRTRLSAGRVRESACLSMVLGARSRAGALERESSSRCVTQTSTVCVEGGSLCSSAAAAPFSSVLPYARSRVFARAACRSFRFVSGGCCETSVHRIHRRRQIAAHRSLLAALLCQALLRQRPARTAHARGTPSPCGQHKHGTPSPRQTTNEGTQ